MNRHGTRERIPAAMAVRRAKAAMTCIFMGKGSYPRAPAMPDGGLILKSIAL